MQRTHTQNTFPLHAHSQRTQASHDPPSSPVPVAGQQGCEKLDTLSQKCSYSGFGGAPFHVMMNTPRCLFAPNWSYSEIPSQ